MEKSGHHLMFPVVGNSVNNGSTKTKKAGDPTKLEQNEFAKEGSKNIIPTETSCFFFL